MEEEDGEHAKKVAANNLPSQQPRVLPYRRQRGAEVSTGTCVQSKWWHGMCKIFVYAYHTIPCFNCERQKKIQVKNKHLLHAVPACAQPHGGCRRSTSEGRSLEREKTRGRHAPSTCCVCGGPVADVQTCGGGGGGYSLNANLSRRTTGPPVAVRTVLLVEEPPPCQVLEVFSCGIDGYLYNKHAPRRNWGTTLHVNACKQQRIIEQR